MNEINKEKKEIPIARVLYPWYKMEIGDSFDMPLKKDTRAQNQSINGSVNIYRKNHNIDFGVAVRKLEDCMRVWRIK